MNGARVRLWGLVTLLCFGVGGYGAAVLHYGRSAPKAQSLPPLKGHGTLHLQVPESPDALVVPPTGSTRPGPVLMVLSEPGLPTTDCESWRAVVGPAGFVLCADPNLVRAGDAASATRALKGALRALKARWPQHVAPGAVVLAGLGQGARLATALSAQEPSFFSRLVLDGHGLSDWTSSYATIFQRRGGERVLIVCGDEACTSSAQRTKLWMQGAALEAKVVTYPAGWTESLSSAWAWLVDGDPRWAARRPSAAHP